MNINDLPQEILSAILEQAAVFNAQDGATFTYGLTEILPPLQKDKLSRYVRGPINPDALKWDSSCCLRRVCNQWHDWALNYSLASVSIGRWRGSERWAELSSKRKLFDIYELIERPSGFAVYRDPYGSLRQTVKLFDQFPDIAEGIRRLWFNGFYNAETDHLIFKALRSCRNLTNISVPWTLLRHGTAEEWTHLLGIANDFDRPLKSLELQAICLRDSTTTSPDNRIDQRPLLDPRVDFGKLRRLKIIGNTTFMPINDDDMSEIARTASHLEEFHITSLSTISIAGVISIVRASRSTLQVLEHSPRSDDGFYHPDPGALDTNDHICAILTDCPKLRDLSISVPSMCADLFSNPDVAWEGECQVRAMRLCHHATRPNKPRTSVAEINSLRRVLDAARELIAGQRRRRKELDIEIFFADCIFDPRDCVVHGDFSVAEISSNGLWPVTKIESGKGPYGSTGLYGKDEGNWEIVREEEFLRAVERGWISL